MSKLPKRKTIIFDIDGVVADERWRRYMLPGRGKYFEVEVTPGAFDTYHKAARDDKPVGRIQAAIANAIDLGWDVLYFTARPDAFYEDTIEWLRAQWGESRGVEVINKKLYMRPEGNIYSSENLKQDMLLDYFGDMQTARQSIIAFIDDNQAVCDMANFNGITNICYLIDSRESNRKIENLGI